MYYDTNEAAELLGFTNETIRRKIRKGEIKAFKVRDKLKIPKEEIKGYLERIIKVDNAAEDQKEDIINNILMANQNELD